MAHFRKVLDTFSGEMPQVWLNLVYVMCNFDCCFLRISKVLSVEPINYLVIMNFVICDLIMVCLSLVWVGIWFVYWLSPIKHMPCHIIFSLLNSVRWHRSNMLVSFCLKLITGVLKVHGVDRWRKKFSAYRILSESLWGQFIGLTKF